MAKTIRMDWLSAIPDFQTVYLYEQMPDTYSRLLRD